MKAEGKVYTLKNGYSISKSSCYNGYYTEYFWVIWKPTGEHYMTCRTYDEAYKLGSRLVSDAN